jgi:hypothetical protein
MANPNGTKRTGKVPVTGGKRGPSRILKSENTLRGTPPGGASLPTMRSMTALFSLLVVLCLLSLYTAALAQQDPCEEVGSDCRPLTTSEVAALKERFLALRAAVPVPDAARWAPPVGVDEAYTMPFIAELKLGGAMICVSWPGGCFPEKNDVSFIYDAVKKSDKPAEKPKESTENKSLEEKVKELAASTQEMQAEFANRIEVDAKLLPHAYLVDEVDGKCVDVTEEDAVTIEKSATFLSWESGDGTRLTMVFGPRTCKEVETLRVEKPAKVLAPVKSVVLEVVGPNKAEVAALKQKIDRKAFEALLGDVVK